MNDVLVNMMAVKFLANDLHYMSKGSSFYALHLLADKIDFGSLGDELKETYYLPLGNIPPRDVVIAAQVCNKITDVEPTSNIQLLSRISYALDELIVSIQTVKSSCSNLYAGVQSVLDSIQQKSLVFKALVDRTLMDE